MPTEGIPSSGNIGRDAAHINPRSLPLCLTDAGNGTIFFIHSIGLYSRKRWWRGAIKEFRATLRNPHPRKCARHRKKVKIKIKGERRWHTMVFTRWTGHGVTEATRLLLARWQREGREFYISRVDVTRDERYAHMARPPEVEIIDGLPFVLGDEDDQVLPHIEYLAENLRLKWPSRPSRPVWYNDVSFYLNGYSRTVHVYFKSPRWRMRTELKFEDSEIVRRNGLDDMDKLPDVDLQRVFWKHLRERSPL